MVFDLAFGTDCDHMVREYFTPVINGADVDVEIRAKVDSVVQNIRVYRNGVEETGLSFSFNVARPLFLKLLGFASRVNAALYPPDDFEVLYKVIADSCPKCQGGNW